jgi:hypothetical protein
MAKGTTKTVSTEPMGRDLEELDIEVRSPSVVISVRVDNDTARQLHRLAKRRGVRVSEVLRDAATDYARAAGIEGETGILVTGPDIRVSVGRRGITSEANSRTVLMNDPGWSRPVQTGIALRTG